jgi:phasin
MSKESPSPFGFPADMLALTEQSLDQARSAFEKLMGIAHTTIGTAEDRTKVAQAGARDISAKVMDFAEQNIAEAFAYAQRLVHARDPQALVALHTEFVQSQIKVLTGQAKALSEAAGNLARTTSRPKP